MNKQKPNSIVLGKKSCLLLDNSLHRKRRSAPCWQRKILYSL